MNIARNPKEFLLYEQLDLIVRKHFEARSQAAA